MNWKMTILCALACPGMTLAASHAEDSRSDRLATLETGEQVQIPDGWTNVPGQPMLISGDQLEQVALARKQLEQQGYVDRPEDAPLAQRTARFMRQELAKRERGVEGAAAVFDVEAFDFTTVKVGKVDRALIGEYDEAYILRDANGARRTYVGTRLGDIHIHEMFRTELGVIGENGKPGISIAGAEGYQTAVRYADGQMATLVLLPVRGGAMLVEIGDTFGRPDRRQVLEDFLTRLVVETEG